MASRLPARVRFFSFKINFGCKLAIHMKAAIPYRPSVKEVRLVGKGGLVGRLVAFADFVGFVVFVRAIRKAL